MEVTKLDVSGRATTAHKQARHAQRVRLIQGVGQQYQKRALPV